MCGVFEPKRGRVLVFVRRLLDRVGPHGRVGQRLARTKDLPDFLQCAGVAEVKLGKAPDDSVPCIGKRSQPL